MMELTKERLQQIVHAAGLEPWDYEEVFDGITTGEIVMMARQLLAGLEQEPVAYYFPGGEREIEQVSLPDDIDDEQKANCIPLYAAPQLPQPAVVPQPVSAVKGELAFIDHLERIIGERDEDIDIGQLGRGNYDALMLAALDSFRAAMLQGAEPVQEWIPCSERMPDFDTRVILYFPDYGGHIEDGCIGDEGDGPYHYFFDGDSLRHEPTHWMPLPATPQ